MQLSQNMIVECKFKLNTWWNYKQLFYEGLTALAALVNTLDPDIYWP